MIKQKGDKWLLYTRDGSRVLGTHDSPEQAQAQERAIQMRQHGVKQAGMVTDLLHRATRPSGMTDPVVGPIIQSVKHLGYKSGITPAFEALKGRVDRAIYEGLVSQQAKRALMGYLEHVAESKQAGVLDMPVPEGVLREVEAGDPAAAAELKRYEEAHARQVFSGRHGLRPSPFGRSLLGRVRDPGASLTNREEELLKKHPDLGRLAAFSQPNKTYPVSRFMTHPGVAAIPAAGVGALLARIIAQAAGAEGSTKEIATAGGGAFGGVVGSAMAHAMRQRHARKLDRRLTDQEQIERRISDIYGPHEKAAGVLGQVLSDVIDVPRPSMGTLATTPTSMGTMSPYRAPNAAAIIAQLRSRRGKMASLTDVLPFFIESLRMSKS